MPAKFQIVTDNAGNIMATAANSRYRNVPNMCGAECWDHYSTMRCAGHITTGMTFFLRPVMACHNGQFTGQMFGQLGHDVCADWAKKKMKKFFS
jgi:hypothetical protein